MMQSLYLNQEQIEEIIAEINKKHTSLDLMKISFVNLREIILNIAAELYPNTEFIINERTMEVILTQWLSD